MPSRYGTGGGSLPLVDPTPWIEASRLWLNAAETAFYSAVTINARLQQIGLALLTGSAFPHAEVWRMTSEKPVAAMESLMAAWRSNAGLAADPRALVRAGKAGLRPYTRKTRSNARRLTR
jgi:hypothetical protein